MDKKELTSIEVKNCIHPNFVKELAEERIEKFRKFFPEYSDYSAYIGIAKQVGEGVEDGATLCYKFF
jgi:hypothetical protein